MKIVIHPTGACTIKWNFGKILSLKFHLFRLHSAANKLKNRALRGVGRGNRGMARNYNIVSNEKITNMMKVQFQQRTEVKIKWAVKCYNDWRNMKLDSDVCDREILEADIECPGTLTKVNLEFALCRFICEVRKSRSDGEYPGKTLYQLACALQNYLKKQNLHWKIVHSSEFGNFQRVLDNVMQERAAEGIGTTTRQAQVISLDTENSMWDQNMLGEDTPDKLRDTVLYIVGVNCGLRAGDEHYNLRRPGGCTTSQFSFEANENNVKCVVYREDTVTKTNKGGLRDMKKTRKEVWIKPGMNWKRCPVRLIEKYLHLLPKTGVKPNFYLQSLKRTKPSCWYSTMPVGSNTLHKVVGTLLKNAGLDGFFSNHSLRRTCATRLFQAGQSSKIVKEITGHISDAVEKYQTTSTDQKMHVSGILQGEIQPIKLSQAEPMQNCVP